MASFSLLLEHVLERLDRHAGLLRAEVLHAEAEDAGELGEIIDVAAGVDQLRDVARPPSPFR
jgi:hypothetical protein